MTINTRAAPPVNRHNGPVPIRGKVEPEPMPPSDIDAEEAVLGSILIDPDCLDKLLYILEPSRFYRESNGWVYDAACGLYLAGKAIDAVTLAAELREQNRLDAIGGVNYLARLVAMTPTSVHAEDYAHIVRQRAAAREIVNLSRRLTEKAYANEDPGDLLAYAAERLQAIEATPGRRHTAYTASELLTATFPEPVCIVPGLLTAGLGMLGGRPKLGKSWMGLQLSCAVGSGGHFLGHQLERGKVVYYALEDSGSRLQKRMQLQQWPADVDVTFYLTLPGGLTEIVRMIERERPALVIVDTFSRLLRTTDDPNQIAIVTAALGPLQQAALANNCAVLMIDHLNKRSGQPGGDWLDDFMNSTGKTAVPDTLWGLYRTRGEEIATLRTAGREIADEKDLAIRFDKPYCTWQLEGDADEVKMARNKKTVLAGIRELGGQGTTAQIAEHTDLDRGYVSRLLAGLAEEGKVTRLAPIGREVPYALTVAGRGSSDE